MLLSNEDSVADAKVLDQVGARVHLVLNLKVTTAMLLSSLLVLVWNDEVIDHSFHSRLFLIKVGEMLFDTFLAPEVNIAITQVLLLPIDHAPHGDPLHIRCHIVRVHGVLWTRSLRLMAHKAKSVDLDLLTFDQGC